MHVLPFFLQVFRAGGADTEEAAGMAEVLLGPSDVEMPSPDESLGGSASVGCCSCPSLARQPRLEYDVSLGFQASSQAGCQTSSLRISTVRPCEGLTPGYAPAEQVLSFDNRAKACPDTQRARPDTIHAYLTGR